MSDLLKVFDASFKRVTEAPGLIFREDFYEKFYMNFLSVSEEVRKKFSHTDFGRQRRMLHDSLSIVKQFYLSHEITPELTAITVTHNKGHHDVGPNLYDLWLEAIIKTVREIDPEFNSEVELAWRIVLAPGITYMKFIYLQKNGV